MPHPSFIVSASPTLRSPAALRTAFDGYDPVFPERNFTISGVTKDSTGAATAGVTVKLFKTATDTIVATTVSDASGNYSFIVDKTQFYYEVSYLVGSPDIAGTTKNNLTGV